MPVPGPLVRHCVKKSPDSAEYRYHLGLALVATGHKELGKTQLQALQINTLGTHVSLARNVFNG
jgi:hypothetical protein